MSEAVPFLEYGALGLLALVLVGLGFGLNKLLTRWLNQIDANIETQKAQAEAAMAMANAMNTLNETVKAHGLQTAEEHRALMEAIGKRSESDLGMTARGTACCRGRGTGAQARERSPVRECRVHSVCAKAPSALGAAAK